MAVQTWRAPNIAAATTDAEAREAMRRIDGNMIVASRLGLWFHAHQVRAGSPQPDLAVELEAGHVFNPGFDGGVAAITEVAAQTVGGFSTPAAGTTRIDRVVVDAITGAASRIAGVAQTLGSPTAVPPAIPEGTLPICQVRLTEADTVVRDRCITDERVLKARPAVQAAFTDNAEDGSDLAVYTFSGVDLGIARPGRIIVVGVKENASGDFAMSSVTVGGVALSKIVEARGGVGSGLGASLWSGLIETGASGDVVVTYAGVSSRCSIGVWAVYGADPTAADSDGDAPGISVSIDVPAKGAAIGYAYTNGSAGTAWAGVSQDFNAAVETTRNHAGAHQSSFSAAQSGLSISHTGGNEAGRAIVAVSFRQK